MGILLPSYKKAVVQNMIDALTANTTQYYAVASNPVPWSPVPTATQDDYSAAFEMNWNLLFGKRLSAADVKPVINNVSWTTNTVYAQYSDLTDSLDSAPFYVVTQPVTNGPWNIYKCVFNNYGAASVNVPDQVQQGSFTKADGYTWRYITTITNADYGMFGSAAFVPVYANASIVSGALQYSGVDVVHVTNSGTGYTATTSGLVQSIVNSTLIQIQTTASPFNDVYTLSGIYLVNNLSSTSQLGSIQQYVANTSGNWVYLNSAANTQNIITNVTQYVITPRVVFQTDGNTDPQAYSTVAGGSITGVNVIDTGSFITWANVSIVANSDYGSGAITWAVVDPPGGHGADPVSELFVQGVAVAFMFSNTESNTIPVGINYNRIGIMKDLCVLQDDLTKGVAYGNATFSQVLVANVSPAVTFGVGEQVVGQNSGALGTVAFSNTTTLWLTGDQYFNNGEYVTDGANTTVISVNTTGDVYVKDQRPLYVQNITNVSRSNTTAESFQLVITL